jgi:cytochrome c553
MVLAPESLSAQFSPKLLNQQNLLRRLDYRQHSACSVEAQFRRSKVCTTGHPEDEMSTLRQIPFRKYAGIIFWICTAFALCEIGVVGLKGFGSPSNSEEILPSLSTGMDHAGVARGKYLATIGVCSACHTPSKVSDDVLTDLNYRSDPNWVHNLDSSRFLAGGVAFLIRLSGTQSALVETPNITPDRQTGIGSWNVTDIVVALKTGKRPNGTSLFRFGPHLLFKNLSETDAKDIALYLQSIPPITHQIPTNSLPFTPTPEPDVNVSKRVDAPQGAGMQRADYLTSALTNCAECHSHHEAGRLIPFSGGVPGDSANGAFRLGPDLPIRSTDKGFSTFPYPGYAILYGGNLTRFGLKGDLAWVTEQSLSESIRNGVSNISDTDGRPKPLEHVMPWQFYKIMTDDDARSLARYIKQLPYYPNPLDGKSRLLYFGAQWDLAFKQFYNEDPTPNDKQLFGKK